MNLLTKHLNLAQVKFEFSSKTFLNLAQKHLNSGKKADNLGQKHLNLGQKSLFGSSTIQFKKI